MKRFDEITGQMPSTNQKITKEFRHFYWPRGAVQLRQVYMLNWTKEQNHAHERRCKRCRRTASRLAAPGYTTRFPILWWHLIASGFLWCYAYHLSFPPQCTCARFGACADHGRGIFMLGPEQKVGRMYVHHVRTYLFTLPITHYTTKQPQIELNK